MHTRAVGVSVGVVGQRNGVDLLPWLMQSDLVPLEFLMHKTLVNNNSNEEGAGNLWADETTWILVTLTWDNCGIRCVSVAMVTYNPNLLIALGIQKHETIVFLFDVFLNRVYT